jgi:uncharacterized protein YkwD
MRRSVKLRKWKDGTMKRTQKMMLVTPMATTAITMLLMSRAFAAPAGTTTNCPKNNILNQSTGNGTNDATLPSTGSTLPANLQSLLGQYSQQIQPAAPSATKCPKAQAAQQQYGNLPGFGTVPEPAATPAPTTAPAPTTGTGNAAPAPVTGNMSADESKMINLVNQDRASNGLPALTFDGSLRAGAIAHSQDMSENNYFSHTSPTQGDFTARIRASGVKYTSAGENIAQYGSVEAAEAGFMNSPGHRANILNTGFTRVGIGIVYNQSKGAYYITQWFAN